MSDVVKLSSPETNEYWEIPILFEDEHLLALDKPSRLLTSPDRYDPRRPNLMKLLQHDLERGAFWVRQHGIQYLANAHRLDFETTGIILLAKDKSSLVALANAFGSEKPLKTYVGLVHGAPASESFEVDLKLGPHPFKIGSMRVDRKHGKKARTQFETLERFSGYALLKCCPATGRTHQIRVHLQISRLPLVGDSLYDGKPLFLSALKPNYRFKADSPERALLDRVALHATELRLAHPVSGIETTIRSPWPKDIEVAIKYLRKFAR